MVNDELLPGGAENDERLREVRLRGERRAVAVAVRKSAVDDGGVEWNAGQRRKRREERKKKEAQRKIEKMRGNPSWKKGVYYIGFVDKPM